MFASGVTRMSSSAFAAVAVANKLFSYKSVSEYLKRGDGLC